MFIILEEDLCSLFNYDKPENVVFTSNITSSLNILLNGVIKPGDHIITSSMEHNSVIRPLFNLKNTLNIEIDIVEANALGIVNVKDIENLINSNTKLIVMTHASNVVGSIQPIKQIGDLCKQYGIFFILDTAQSAGVLDVDFKEFSLSALPLLGIKVF